MPTLLLRSGINWMMHEPALEQSTRFYHISNQTSFKFQSLTVLWAFNSYYAALLWWWDAFKLLRDEFFFLLNPPTHLHELHSTTKQATARKNTALYLLFC